MTKIIYLVNTTNSDNIFSFWHYARIHVPVIDSCLPPGDTLLDFRPIHLRRRNDETVMIFNIKYYNIVYFFGRSRFLRDAFISSEKVCLVRRVLRFSRFSQSCSLHVLRIFRAPGRRSPVSRLSQSAPIWRFERSDSIPDPA